ncbi:MAG TPA: YceI family protein [Steroidobacteraceae bacterium]|nr:YceI family protein [Steroidobacteraceae bacterium]
MRELTRVGGLIALSLLLAACPRPVRPPAPTPTVPPTPAPTAPTAPDTRGAVVYEVDSASSQLSILVFRGGKLSRLGHNHVMTSNDVHGRAWVHPQFARSGFELSFPVAKLVVDDPQARRAAGSDFPPEIPQSDKDGTRRNMLKPEVLDGERYTEVKVASAKVGGTLQAPQVTARITIKDASREVQVPLKLAVEGAKLTANGEFDILQTEFGIKPFSVALGALEVQDRLHIKFTIVAEKN